MLAIILKKTQFGETNEIVTFFSQEKGKIRGVARAAKSAKSKLASGLQPLFLSEIEFADGRGDIPVITGAKEINAHAGIRLSSNKIAAGLSAIEIILKSTADEQPNSQLFDLLLEYLSYLSDGYIGKKDSESMEIKSIWKFILLVLEFSGFRAQMDSCVICGKKPEQVAKVFFSPRHGGMVCLECANKTAADAFAMSPETVKVFGTGSGSGYRESFLHADKSAAKGDELRIIAENFAAYILERDLKASKFIV